MSVCPYVRMSVCPYVRMSVCLYVRMYFILKMQLQFICASLSLALLYYACASLSLALLYYACASLSTSAPILCLCIARNFTVLVFVIYTVDTYILLFVFQIYTITHSFPIISITSLYFINKYFEGWIFTLGDFMKPLKFLKFGWDNFIIRNDFF